MKKQIIASLLMAVTWSANARVKFVATSNTHYRHINYNTVIIYLDKDKVPENAEQIGLVLCEGEKLDKLMIRARKVASDYGANGLYMVKGEDNDILTSRRRNEHEKELNADKKEDYKNTITFVAVRVPVPADSTQHK